MPVNRHIRLLFCCLFFGLSLSVSAQYGFSLDIKKPEPYENRELKAEKTGEGKLKAPKRFMQNMTTHYNYFFNANNKLNEIVDRAKAAHKDDYNALLPFYNYSLKVTASDSAMLDSVIYKSKAAIVLHDLRNDWIDDMYLLWGASYYLQQNFDSAYGMFQFINYAFAEKEADGYYKYIGSRMDGNNAASIVTKEDAGFLKRMISDPPGRNTAFIWQVRTLTEQGALPEAGSLIAALRNDPLFPARLLGSLEEVHAYWFYKQGAWDSSAHHLVKALGEAKNKQERARWEYLAAQMFSQKGALELAKEYYNKAIVHTTDPVLEVYARLNLIRTSKGEDEGAIDKNIAELLKMAKRDKYEEYRDVIYSMAAQMELERGNVTAAQELLVKASKFNTANATTGNNAYLQLADLAYSRKQYPQAAAFYDSIKVRNLLTEDAERIAQRKDLLSRLMTEMNIVSRQDSLQRLAALSEEERKDYVKKLVRQLRKEQGLKDDDILTAGGFPVAGPDPFAPTGGRGEWYFYNNSAKTAGAASFAQAWGNRPNVDNWRRFSDVTSQLRKTNLPDPTRGNPNPVVADPVSSVSFDALYNRIPVTPGMLQASQDSIRRALFAMGKVYETGIEDYASAVATYEDIRRRFPLEDPSADLLFALYYNYTKTGNATKAADAKRMLLEKYPTHRYAIILATGKDPLSTAPSEAATKTYEGVYDLFLEGRFEEAKTAKATADSLYKTNYWSPQLLYIEAVYHIKQREDSVARTVLNTLVQQSAGTPIGARAQNLMNVLARRAQIEDELTKLEIVRPAEDSLYVEPMPVAPTVKKTEAVVVTKTRDSLVTKTTPKPVADTIQRKPIATTPGSIYTFKPDAVHYAVVVLNRVDPVFVTEARNAFNRYTKEKFYSQPLELNTVAVSRDIKLVLVGKFNGATGAIDYVQKTKPVASSQVVPWLKGDKFSFTVISEENLAALLGAKDFAAYKNFIDAALPVKF